MIEGTCDPAFTAVRDAFQANFDERDELGAAVAVDVGGRLVVDLWGGHADAGRTRVWERDTIVDVFSVGKAMATLALLVLVDDGRLDLDAPVVQLWPEFAQHDKGDVTPRTVLSHRAGLPGIVHDLPDDAMYRFATMTEALAAEAPWWPPGSAHGYHVNTFGFLVGELVQRASGEEFARFFAREVAGRAGADFTYGLTEAEQARVAEFVFTGERSVPGAMPDGAAPPDERAALLGRVYANPPGISGIGTVNTAAWRAAVHPSTNGHGNARAVVALYRLLAAGGARGSVRLVSKAVLDEATTEHSAGTDAVLQRPSRFGLGFQLTQAERPIGPNSAVFGHFGAGGSLGFADRDAALAFGYTMSRFGARWQDPRNQALIRACYECV